MEFKNIHVSGKFTIGRPGNKYVFVISGNEKLGSENYRSRIYKSPTVADLIEAADESVDVTEDRHHIFLESYTITADQAPQGEDDVGEIEIHFGS